MRGFRACEFSMDFGKRTLVVVLSLSRACNSAKNGALDVSVAVHTAENGYR